MLKLLKRGAGMRGFRHESHMCSPSADENAVKDQSMIIQNLQMIARRIDGLAMVSSHTRQG